MNGFLVEFPFSERETDLMLDEPNVKNQINSVVGQLFGAKITPKNPLIIISLFGRKLQDFSVKFEGVDAK